jgi:hypothetical protein
MSSPEDLALIFAARLLGGAWFAASGAAWLSGELYLQVLTIYSFYEEVILNFALQQRLEDRPMFGDNCMFFGGTPNFEIQLLASLALFVLVLKRHHTLSAYGFVTLVVLPLLLTLALVYGGECTLWNAMFAAAVGVFNGIRKALLYEHILQPLLYLLPTNPLFIKDVHQINEQK